MAEIGDQLTHDTGPQGGQPCSRCGLRHTGRETAYIPCFVEGDDWHSWYDRLNKGQRDVVDRQRGG